MIFFNIHTHLALANLAWLSISMPLIFLTKKKQFFLAKDSTAIRQKITGLLNDGISNISNVLFFTNRNFEKNLLKKANDQYAHFEQKRIWFIYINHLWIGLIYTILPIVTLFLMINLRQKNLITVGDFVMVLALMFHLFDNSWILLKNIDGLIHDYGNLQEAYTIFNHQNMVIEDKPLVNLKFQNPQIIFENISFKYHDNFVLKDFILKINPTQKIGLAGLS